ncbi:DUF1304 family protein [Gulosibacter molinativorax]|nr:DUF1304 family protein [Gulosibacter molinativorax]
METVQLYPMVGGETNDPLPGKTAQTWGRRVNFSWPSMIKGFVMETLNLVAQIAAIVGAVALIAVAPIEMFQIDKPYAKRFLHVEHANDRDVELWAFCVGARNLIAAVGVFIGLGMIWAGNGDVGTIVVLVASWYMLLSGAAMGVADLLGKWHPRGGSVVGVLGSGIPPLVVIIAAAF